MVPVVDRTERDDAHGDVLLRGGVRGGVDDVARVDVRGARVVLRGVRDVHVSVSNIRRVRREASAANEEWESARGGY